MPAVNARLILAFLNRQRWSWSGGPPGKVRTEPSTASPPVGATGAGEAACIGRKGCFTPSGFLVISTVAVIQPFDSHSSPTIPTSPARRS